MRTAGLCVLLTLGAVFAAPLAQSGQIDPISAEVTSRWVDRFLAGTGQPIESYEALRTLEASTRGGRMRARLTAMTSLDPAQGFRYSILEEEGSDAIRSRVLRATLEAERELHATGEGRRGTLDGDNYRFEGAGPADEGFVQIGLQPKREDKLLIRGRMLLADADADLVSVEGTLVRRPSFWTRRVDVRRRYERLLGVRVPVEMRSTAQVLFVGTSTFSMTYDYETINGSAVPE